jgi:guanylate kinase
MLYSVVKKRQGSYNFANMKKGLLIIMSGPSGVGKGTIRQKVMEDKDLNLFFSVSVTTRQKREGEMHGREYYFISQDEFDKLIEEGKLLEYNRYVGHSYGTPLAPIEEHRLKGENVVLEIDVHGATQVLSKVKGQQGVVTIFLLPPSYEELEKRIRGRCTENDDTIQMRLKQARDEIAQKGNYMYNVINDTLDRCADEVKKIIRKELGAL